MRTAIAVLVLALAGGMAAAERPKIGLALAGGGAKGGAHVGVLKVLEELEVPIDYIAGTSIGAIVGGLYATGMSVEELEHELTSADWDDLLRDKPSREDLSFRRKEDDSRYLFDAEIGVRKSGLLLPAGLIGGQKLFFMLQSLTLRASGVRDFDRLPIPFRAIATDVNSGEMVVIGEGNLATAIRASMALPFIFTPVTLEDRLLMDGGLVNNVPVDVVREMGAEIVIAVDLGAPLTSREVESMVQVLSQTTRMLTRPNMESRLEQADLVLTPPTEGSYGTMDFHKIGEIIPLGEAAAREKETELRAYSIDADAYERHRGAQLSGRPEPMPLDFVRIEGNERVDRRILENLMRTRPGAELDLDVLFADLNRIFGLGDFEGVDFRLVEEGGKHGVVIHAREKPWGPNYLHLGLGVQTDLDGESQLGLLTNLTLTRINRLGAEWRNDLLLGSDRVILSEFYQPLDFKGRWFIAPKIEVEELRFGFFDNGARLADLDVNIETVSVDLGYQFSKFAELRLGIERGRAGVDVATGVLPQELTSSFDLDDIDFGGIAFEANSDRLDSASLPRDGSSWRLRAFVSLESLGADEEYDRLDSGGLLVRSLRRHTVIGSYEAGWSPGSVLPQYDLFTLGGFASLSGFAENELRGQYLAVLRAGYFYNLVGNLYVGGWAELGNVWQTSDEIDLDSAISALTAFAGADTRFGPIYLAFGQAEEGKNKVYVSVGRTLP